MLDRRLAIVVGKGGTGRTTVATVLAALAARRGMRVLLCEIHGRDRATRLLGHPAIGDRLVEVRPGLHVANVTPAAALEEYVVGVVRSPRLFRSLFGGQAVAAFVRALPGLDDLMMIGKVRFHAEETSPAWDLVVVDAPATGNGLYFLEVPDAVLRVVGTGPLAYYARKQRALLRDARRTAVHLVTLAEEMPVVESLELVGALEDRLELPLGRALVNRVRPRPFAAAEEALLGRLQRRGGELGRHVAAGRWTLGRWTLQRRYLARMRRAWRDSLLELPDLAEPALGPASIDRLADALAAQL